ISGNPSFKELSQRVKKSALEAYSHQDLPFERLVEHVQPKRDTSRPPLFQVMFALQNTPNSALELPGLTISPMEAEWNISKFDLTLSMADTEQGLTGFFRYNTDLFNESTISRMVAHFRNTLEGVVADSMRRISELPLMSADERRQLLVEWNQTKA